MKRTMAAFAVAMLAVILSAQLKAPEKPVKIDRISSWFEGVSFDHKTHQSVSCGSCHHTGVENGARCSGCHPVEKSKPADVSLKDAYHKACFACHEEKGKDVKEACESCHKRKKLPKPE